MKITQVELTSEEKGCWDKFVANGKLCKDYPACRQCPAASLSLPDGSCPWKGISDPKALSVIVKDPPLEIHPGMDVTGLLFEGQKVLGIFDANGKVLVVYENTRGEADACYLFKLTAGYMFTRGSRKRVALY